MNLRSTPRRAESPARPNATRRADAAVVASRLHAALAQRTWSIAGQDPRQPCQLFLVLHGKAVFADDSGHDLEFSAPFLLWLPRSATGEFRLEAGGDGIAATIAEDFAWRIVGDSPVAAHLRPMLERPAIASSERVGAHLPEVQTSFAALVRELQEHQTGGGAMMALHLGIVLLHLWRAAGGGATQALRGGASTTVQRYRQLVELHYRENLGIADYAAKLGSTRAHLHDACLRAAGATPLALVHARLLEEAQSRLEQTDLPVEQIGYSLGFRDPGYFNRFFKRLSGQTPRAYRQTAQSSRPAHEPSSFAAWP